MEPLQPDTLPPHNELVINRMYSGDYLQNNLGHEVINMYESDEGGYYLYLNPLGSFHRKHSDRVKRMLLVRSTSYKACVEVIGMAQGLSDMPQDAKSQDVLVQKIHYGGVSLKQLFDSNESKQDCFVTFRAQQVWHPTVPTYIVFKDGTTELDSNPSLRVIHLADTNQAKTSLKQYFSEEEQSRDYRRLLDLFEEPRGEAMPKVNPEELRCPTEKNFFEVCGIDNSELAFSNIFAHFLEKYPGILHEMATEYGHSIDCTSLTVKRETEMNIDLFVETPSHIVVIENKVLSDINGREHATDKGESQLGKYYWHVTKSEEREKDKRAKLFVVLTPDHNNVNISQYTHGDKYTKVYYSQVRDFLKGYVERHHLQSDIYMQEMLTAMHKHCQKFYNELFDKTEQRLYRTLREKRQG